MFKSTKTSANKQPQQQQQQQQQQHKLLMKILENTMNDDEHTMRKH